MNIPEWFKPGLKGAAAQMRAAIARRPLWLKPRAQRAIYFLKRLLGRDKGPAGE